MGEILQNIKPRQLYAVLLFIVGVVLLILGIVFLSTYNEVHTNNITLTEYSNCKDRMNKRCADVLPSKCVCDTKWNLENDLPGNVTMYYELETFMQNNASYVNSRDNKQLAGDLSLEPSKDCGEFTYDETPTGRMPIAPCGAIADSMFNDSFFLVSNGKIISALNSGMLSDEDKKGFHNPPGKSLELAFEGYTKPKNWVSPVWDLTTSVSNNGFENEAFIAWMRTDWKRKPMWRIDPEVYPSGLSKGSYTIRITFAYPESRYSGPRKLIAENVYNYCNTTKYVAGIVTVVIGSIFLVALLLGLVFLHYKPRYAAVES